MTDTENPYDVFGRAQLDDDAEEVAKKIADLKALLIQEIKGACTCRGGGAANVEG